VSQTLTVSAVDPTNPSPTEELAVGPRGEVVILVPPVKIERK